MPRPLTPAYAYRVSARDYGLLVLLGAIWGASFMFIKVALQDMAPVTLVAARVGLGAVGLVAYSLVSRSAEAKAALDRRWWVGFVVLALFSGVFPYVLIAAGEVVIPSGSAAILNATSPLFSAGLALLVARGSAEEALSGPRVVGLLLGVAGVGLLVARPAESAAVQASALEVFGGHLAVVAASACYAIAALYTRRSMMGVRPLALSTGQNTAAAIIMIPAALLLGGPFRPWGADTIVCVLLLGLVNTSAAYLIYYRLVTRAGATRALSVTYLQPATALVYGALLLAEPVTLPQLLGLGAILAGVALATRPVKREPAAAGVVGDVG